MGSQLSSTFLGIESLCFSFSSLILTRASVMCLVKATCISLASGLLARFCKNIITSEILQPSISKSNLASLVVGSIGLGIVGEGKGTTCGLVVMVHTLLLEICPRGNNKVGYYHIFILMINVYIPC